MTKSKLNSTNWALYNFLKTKTNDNPNHWVTHGEICSALPMDFSMNHQACKKICCSKIQRHIIEINESNEIEKIILYKNQSYKLATSNEEAESFIKEKLLIKGCRILKRYWQILDKINKDGQGKILSSRGDIIDESSKTRRFVESFINGSLESESACDDKITIENDFDENLRL